MNFDPQLADDAGQDSLWSMAILLGALDGQKVKPEVLSYEGPFGVGYMVAELSRSMTDGTSARPVSKKNDRELY